MVDYGKDFTILVEISLVFFFFPDPSGLLLISVNMFMISSNEGWVVETRFLSQKFFTTI